MLGHCKYLVLLAKKPTTNLNYSRCLLQRADWQLHHTSPLQPKNYKKVQLQRLRSFGFQLPVTHTLELWEINRDLTIWIFKSR